MAKKDQEEVVNQLSESQSPKLPDRHLHQTYDQRGISSTGTINIHFNSKTGSRIRIPYSKTVALIQNITRTLGKKTGKETVKIVSWMYPKKNTSSGKEEVVNIGVDKFARVSYKSEQLLLFQKTKEVCGDRVTYLPDVAVLLSFDQLYDSVKDIEMNATVDHIQDGKGFIENDILD